MNCFKCGVGLSADEIGLSKKLINRATDKFMCVNCLAEYHHCSAELLRDKIEYFRKSGCTLFAPKKN